MANGLTGNPLKLHNNKEIALYIASILQEIRFGSVEALIHDGRVVQIDKRERFRITDQKPAE